MKKINKDIFWSSTVIACLIATIISLCILSCDTKPNNEVVKVNKELMESRDWEEAFFNIECVDSLQHEGNYYWFIYDDPDAFETTLCVSTDKETYEELQTFLKFKELGAYKRDTISFRQKLERFHLYYGQCEETILIFE